MNALAMCSRFPVSGASGGGRWLAGVLALLCFLALASTLEAIPTRGAAGYLDMPSGVRTYNAYRLPSYTPAPMTKTLPPPPATMTYDTDNRLATYNGQAVSSDANGNLLAAPVAGTLLGALTWDARNRLTSAGGVSYAYDAENRRISSTQSGQTTTYTWSRGAALDRLLVKTNPDGSVTRYIYGLGLISEETTPASGAATILFYHYNWQGSTMALSDASGNVTARLAYSPYGERTVVSGTVTTPFCFNGQFGVMTEPNGLLTMQARYYSPIFRRFLSEDPSGFSGGINLYAYTGGDPVNFMDPFGLGPQGFLGGFQKGFTFENVAIGAGVAVGIIALEAATGGAATPFILAAATGLGSYGATTAVMHVAASDNPSYTAGVYAGSITAGAVGGGVTSLGASAIRSGATAVAKSEVTVYRAFGGDSRAQGFSWTTTDPRTVSNFRDVAGLPSGGASQRGRELIFDIYGI